MFEPSSLFLISGQEVQQTSGNTNIYSKRIVFEGLRRLTVWTSHISIN